MKSTTKTVLFATVITAMVLLIPCVFLVSFAMRIYNGRYIESEPNQVISIVEWAFDANFPTESTSLRAAKTKNHDGLTLFLVGFSASEAAVAQFLDSFPIRTPPRSYEPDSDRRGKIWMFSPAWMKTPIHKGKTVAVTSTKGSGGTSADIYVDTNSGDDFVVYVDGAYLSAFEQTTQNAGKHRTDQGGSGK
jgi:hypothetical protein